MLNTNNDSALHGHLYAKLVSIDHMRWLLAKVSLRIIPSNGSLWRRRPPVPTTNTCSRLRDQTGLVVGQSNCGLATATPQTPRWQLEQWKPRHATLSETRRRKKGADVFSNANWVTMHATSSSHYPWLYSVKQQKALEQSHHLIISIVSYYINFSPEDLPPKM